MNRKLKLNSCVPDLEVDGSTLSDDQTKATAFNTFFCSTFTADNDRIPPLSFNGHNNHHLPNVTVKFDNEAVLLALNKLKPSLSTGPDDINAFVLKKLKFNILDPLSTIFEVSYRTGKLPELWKQALVTPIFKKGSAHLVENYRPISLCCVTCKLMESIINKCLVEFLSVNQILNTQQFGFQKVKSCTLQLLTCFNDWSQLLDEKKFTDVVYIDFQKAFDSVVHTKLIFKLESLIPSRFFLAWVKDFLTNRTQVVRLNRSDSTPVEVISGVPQGSVLGPTLFLIFINDLVDCIKHSKVLLFADDLKIYNTHENNALLQSDLDRLCSWSSNWQLPISVSKSYVLYLGKLNPKHKYVLDHIELADIGSSCKDLGVYVSSNLNSAIHCENVRSKASKISALIHRTFISGDTSLKVRAFKTYVRPILEYATIVWNPHNSGEINKIESIQRRFTKRLFNTNLCLSYDERLNLLNLERLELRRIYFDAQMAYNIIKRSILPPCNFYRGIFYSKTRSHTIESLYINRFYSDARKFCFAIRSAYIWNFLPVEIRNSPTLAAFKKGIENIDFSRFLKGRT